VEEVGSSCIELGWTGESAMEGWGQRSRAAADIFFIGLMEQQSHYNPGVFEEHNPSKEEKAVATAKRIALLQRGLAAYTLYRASSPSRSPSPVDEPRDVQAMRSEVDELLFEVAKLMPEISDNCKQTVMNYCSSIE